MRTTATDAAVAHANLMPLLFLLQKLCFQVYTRMSTLPKTNPIHDEIQKVNRQHKHHKSPLHHLSLTFTVHPKDIEEIWAPHHPLKWNPDIDIVIDRNKEDASSMQMRQKKRYKFSQMGQDTMGELEQQQSSEGLEEMTRFFTSTLEAIRSIWYIMVNRLEWCKERSYYGERATCTQCTWV